MRTVLTVREPFGGHPMGHRIEDPAEVKAILEGPHAHHVIVSAIPVEPEAQAEQKPVAKSKA